MHGLTDSNSAHGFVGFGGFQRHPLEVSKSLLLHSHIWALYSATYPCRCNTGWRSCCPMESSWTVKWTWSSHRCFCPRHAQLPAVAAVVNAHQAETTCFLYTCLSSAMETRRLCSSALLLQSQTDP